MTASPATLHHPTHRASSPRWMARWLQAAAVYNLLWGAWVVLFPSSYWNWLGMDLPRYPQLWQCVGMIVGVYGIGYWAASKDPVRHWPIVLVGFLGKIFGPLGFVQAIATDALPLAFGTILLTNDLIWWVPFGMILWHGFRENTRPPGNPELVGLDRAALMDTLQSSAGKTVAEHSRQAPHLVVFLRHFGCTFCREAVAQIRASRVEIEAQGTGLLIIHMASPEQSKDFLASHGLEDVPHVSDPSASLYRAFGLGRGTFGQLFGWRSWVGGLRAARHGVGPLMGDGMQMPGAFLIQNGKVAREYRHSDASSQPDYCELAGVSGDQAIPTTVAPAEN